MKMDMEINAPMGDLPRTMNGPGGEEALTNTIVAFFMNYNTMAPELNEFERKTIMFNLRFAEYLRTAERHGTAIMFLESAIRILEGHRNVS